MQQQESNEELEMKFSFLTYQFARYPLEYCFYMAKEYGFNGVEVWGARPHAYPYDMDNTMIRQVIAWKKKRGKGNKKN